MTVCQCGIPLERQSEIEHGVCLPCQLGSVPLSAGVELERDTSRDADRECDGEYVIVDTGITCAKCGMPMVETEPYCFWCDQGLKVAS